MQGIRGRLPFWLLLALGAVALQALSLFVGSVTKYATVVRPCASGPSPCLVGQLVPTLPYLGLGVALFAGGTALMGAAISIRRRTRRWIRHGGWVADRGVRPRLRERRKRNRIRS